VPLAATNQLVLHEREANQLVLHEREMRASKYCDPISVYEAHLDGFGYEAGDLAGGAELDDLQHGGRRAPQQRPAASCPCAPRRRRPGPHGCGRRTARLCGGGQLAVLPAEIAVVPGQAEPPRGQRVAPGAGGVLQPDPAPAVLADGGRAGGIAEAEVGLLLAPAQRPVGVAFKPI